MISVLISSISQELNFKTKQQQNFVTCCLPNGQKFKALVDDGTAQMIVQLAVNSSTDVVHSVTPSAVNGFSPSGEDTQVFGGNIDMEKIEESVALSGVESMLSDAPPPVPPPAAPKPQADVEMPATTMKAKFIGRNEFGYPMVEFPGGVSPHLATGTIGEGDEDGVRQL